ncbi:MAG: alginate export family protein [candidate division Zixibacteria bacterium]|nr:alginate export family protein [candidate division Zixibacteria bacterium]
MTRTVKLLPIMLILFCMCGITVAETTVDVSAQMRARNEISSKAISGDKSTQEATYLRTRVNVKAAKENVSAFVQFQDSRMLGAGAQSGGLYDAHNVDLHQAYVTIDHLWNKGIGLKAGRFEVILGNQRVFGSVGWHNVGRSWEGLQAWYDCKYAMTSAYWLKKAERNNTEANTDYDIIGFSSKLKSMNLELLFFIEQDAFKPTMVWFDDDDLMTSNSVYKNLERFNLGMYYQRDYQQFDFDLNAVYQFGKKQNWVTHETLGYDSEEIDLAAMMFTFEAGYNLEGDYKPRFAFGIDYTTGDDSETLDKVETYNNLFYTGHKFRGYMDYFLGSQTNGLMDIMLRGRVSPVEGWTIKGDLHFFSRTQDYTDFEGNETKSVGTEFDLTVSTKRVAGVGLSSGLSFFMPSEAYAGTTETNTGLWFYTQAVANF